MVGVLAAPNRIYGQQYTDVERFSQSHLVQQICSKRTRDCRPIQPVSSLVIQQYPYSGLLAEDFRLSTIF